MGRDAIALYGPPGSGKDTVTAALHRLEPRYVLFRKLKKGTLCGPGYRPASDTLLEQLRQKGQILYENERYGNAYAVDRPSLDHLLDQGSIPVLHVGQTDGITALKKYGAKWLTVLLWCPRHIASQRIRERGSPDTVARLKAWDETAADLDTPGRDFFDMCIHTDQTTPDNAARMIHDRVLHGAHGSIGRTPL